MGTGIYKCYSWLRFISGDSFPKASYNLAMEAIHHKVHKDWVMARARAPHSSLDV